MQHPFQITIRDLEDNLMYIDVTGSMTILDIKKRIFNMLHVDAKAAVVIFRGRKLADTATVKSAGIKNNNTIILNGKFIGGRVPFLEFLLN